MPSALPAAFAAALALDHVSPESWVEIEGLPWAYGLSDRAAGWFASRAAAQQRTGVVGVLLGLPRGAEQEARPLEGDSSIGQMTLQLQLDDAGTVLPLIGNGARRDGQVTVGAGTLYRSQAYTYGDTITWDWGGGAVGAYRCAVPGTTPAIDPTPPTLDQSAFTDGLVSWAYVGRLDLDASTPIYDGIAFLGSAAAFPASGVVYMGRESFLYTSKVQGASTGVFLGVTRGAYALPGLEAKQAHTAGDVVSYYPRFVATRRIAWYSTLDGTDANRVTRWAGTVRGAKLMAGGAGVELVLESLEGDLQAKAFGTQRTGKLAVGIIGADPVDYQPSSDTEPAPETARLVLATDSTSGTWTAGEQLLVRLGDEYIAGTVAVDGIEASLTITGRGCFASAVVQHVPGDDLKEVIWTGAYSATGSAADMVSRFTAGDHPFEVALQFLLSRKGDGANGTYDTLPEGWGIGIDASRVDVAGILATKRTWFPGARHLWVYEEPFGLKTMLSEMLRPHGCYPVTTLGDLLTIRRLSPPIPGVSLRAIGASAIVAVPSWDANIADVVGRIIWRCDFDPISGDPRQTFKGELQGPGTEAQEFYAGLWKTLELDAHGQFTGNDAGSPYFGSNLSTGADEASQRYFEMVRDRYARPFPLIGIECSYDYLDVEVGDLVTLTVSNLPDVTTGALGISGATCEVLRKSIDDVRGVVALTLLHSTTSAQFRLMSPSGVVSGTAAGLITLTDGEFNDSSQDRTAGFYIGQVIQVWNKAMKTSRGTATLTSVTATQLGMASVPAGTVATDVVMLASYVSQGGTERLRHASLAFYGTELLDGVDPAHVYAT